jgi:hypothetical protein
LHAPNQVSLLYPEAMSATGVAGGHVLVIVVEVESVKVYALLALDLNDASPLNESRLVSTKEFIETAALRRGFKSDGTQGQESFLATGILYHVQVQQASILHVNHKLGIHEPTLVSFLIRSPPANRDRDT